MSWEDLSIEEKSDLMRLYISNGIMDLDSIKKHYNSFATGGTLPDHDPNNPYHYHDAKGNKVVVSPEDWEANIGKPYFREIEAAVRAEQAAHPGPEYEVNPAFVRDLRSIYQHNMGSGYQNYKYFSSALPQGYSFTDEGLIVDPQGNYYVQSGFRQSPRFTYDVNSPLQFTINEGKPIKKTLTFYPVNMDMRAKDPLPVNETMNVAEKKRQSVKDTYSIESYILGHGFQGDEYETYPTPKGVKIVGNRLVTSDKSVLENLIRNARKNRPDYNGWNIKTNAISTVIPANPTVTKDGQFTHIDFSTGQPVIKQQSDFSFQAGGTISTPNFVQRYSEGQRRGIKLPNGEVVTHKLSYAEQDGKYIVYPNVQPMDYNNPNSPLYDYEDDNWTAFDRALKNNDTLQFNTAKEAEEYTKHYKDFGREGYLLNIPSKINLPEPKVKLQEGGPINNKSDWAKAHEAELALHQLGWDNPDNKLHSDYAAKDSNGYYAGYNLKPVTVRPTIQQLLRDWSKNNPKAKGIVEYVDPDIVAENNTMGLKLWGALAGVKAPINYKKTLDYLSTPFSSTIKALPINKNNFLKRAGWTADTSLNILGSGDALLNVLNENGVTNTLNAFSKGDYKEGVLSGIGDLWNISSIYGLKKYIPNKLPNVNIFKNRKLNKEWIRNKGYEPLVNDIRTAFIHQNEDFPELFRPARTALIKTNHNQGLNGVKMQFDDHNYILNGSKWYTPWKWDLRNIFYGSAENIPSYTLEPDVIRYHPLTFFTSPKSFQGITAHEINHSFARLYSKKGSLSEFSNAKKGYPFIANDDNVVDLSAFNKRAFKHNGSPEELQSDMRKWKHELNNDQRIPYNYMPTNQQEKYIDLAEEQYFINKDILKKLLTDLSSYGYFQNGGSLGKVTPYGQWQYPGKVTTIPSNNITMKGVDYPVIGVSDTGDTKVMFPNLDYTFNGNYVTEYPINQ